MCTKCARREHLEARVKWTLKIVLFGVNGVALGSGGGLAVRLVCLRILQFDNGIL